MPKLKPRIADALTVAERVKCTNPAIVKNARMYISNGANAKTLNAPKATLSKQVFQFIVAAS
ncbi:hypothetical protein NBRC116583_28360 [Arenicella sp. 4NH20-0111]